jgi:GT2 family glycosyltransferase
MDKEIFSKIGMCDPAFIHAEDYELYFRAMSFNYKFGNTPDYLVHIREGLQSRSRGAEWKIQRRYYIKAKNKALFHYGFTKCNDILYHLFTPLSYFVSPQISLRIKRLTGWYKDDI